MGNRGFRKADIDLVFFVDPEGVVAIFANDEIFADEGFLTFDRRVEEEFRLAFDDFDDIFGF